jgi:hypothetical protein
VYKPHFFDKNLPSKIGVRFFHGILWPFGDRARDAGIVCCQTPSGYGLCLRLILQGVAHARMRQRITGVSAYFD